jgi:hypothetical protein
VKHGLHRWQQGYRLKELMSECGQRQVCVFDELRDIAAAHPELSHDTFVETYRQLLHLINDTVSESEIASSAEAGTTFRVVFPRRYDSCTPVTAMTHRTP